MKITLVSNASVLLEEGDTKILTDPWYSGRIFNDSWGLIRQPDVDPGFFDNITHLWISHEHPNHLNFSTLRLIPESARSRITILFQRCYSPMAADALRTLGFRQVVELPLGRWIRLTDDVQIICCASGIYDSLLAIRSDDVTVLNMNDCKLTSPGFDSVTKKVGPVDVLLTQFSIASWPGNPGQETGPQSKQVLDEIETQIQRFAPRYTIPFASSVYFCHEENRHMNSWINTPDAVSETLKDAPTQLQFPYPGDSWSDDSGFDLQGSPMTRYREDFEQIPTLHYVSHEAHPLEEVLELGQDLVTKVKRHARRFRTARLKPILFYLDDLQAAVCFDLKRGRVSLVGKQRQECRIPSDLKRWRTLSTIRGDSTPCLSRVGSSRSILNGTGGRWFYASTIPSPSGPTAAGRPCLPRGR